MSHVHWWLVGLSFVLGFVLTLALILRPAKGLGVTSAEPAAAELAEPALGMSMEWPTTRTADVMQLLTTEVPDADEPSTIEVPVAEEPVSIEVPDAEGPSTIEVPVAEGPVARPSAGIHDLLSRPTPRAEEAAADAPVAEELAPAEELATVAEPTTDEEPTTGVAFTAEPKGREAPVADGWVSFANPGAGEFPEAKESSAQAPPVEEPPPAEPLVGEPRHTEAPPVKEPRPTQSAHVKKVPPARKAPPGRRGSPAKGSPAKVRPKLPYAPYGPGSARATPEGGGPSGWLVKGRSDTRLYYTPDDPAYPLTVAQVWFKDEQSATRACFTPWRNSSRRK